MADTKAEKESKIEKIEAKEKKVTSKAFLKLILVIVVAGLLWTGYNYFTLKKELSYIKTPEGQVEANRLLVTETTEAASKLLILPESDVDPQVLVIQNAAELAKQQEFYKNAQDNDRLIIYENQAIIYSPERNIIVNVGPVVRNNGENTNNTQLAPKQGEEQTQ